MTLEEATALVIEEGMQSGPVPDNAMAIILHRRKEPSDKHINTLIEALRVVQDGLKEQPFLSRGLAAALWIVGKEANAIMCEIYGEADAGLDATDYQIEDLLTAIESVFCNGWFVEDMRKARGHIAAAVLE